MDASVWIYIASDGLVSFHGMINGIQVSKLKFSKISENFHCLCRIAQIFCLSLSHIFSLQILILSLCIEPVHWDGLEPNSIFGFLNPSAPYHALAFTALVVAIPGSILVCKRIHFAFHFCSMCFACPSILHVISLKH